MTKRRVLLLVLVALVLVVGVAYAYGRATCPPPGWWFSAFRVLHRNYACVYAT